MSASDRHGLAPLDGIAQTFDRAATAAIAQATMMLAAADWAIHLASSFSVMHKQHGNMRISSRISSAASLAAMPCPRLILFLRIDARAPMFWKGKS